MVQMLKSGTAKTFQEYAETVFVPYISARLQKSSHIDLFWDVYLPDSLKDAMRQKTGKGTGKGVSFHCDAKELEELPSSQ